MFMPKTAEWVHPQPIGFPAPDHLALRAASGGKADALEGNVSVEGAGVHALEVLDHFEHADLPVTLDEGLELLRDLVELLGRQAAGKHDLDRLRIVIFLIGKHGPPLPL